MQQPASSGSTHGAANGATHGSGLEIVFDTESTGLDPEAGHRIVEIGCIEIENLVPTGRSYWVYLNPERDIPEDATRIHGIDNAKVKDSPKFADCAAAFLEFIGDEARLVAHNASFDYKFLNYELKLLGRPPLCVSRMVDTLPLARRKFPGAGASLDALCRRFEIDLSRRDFHGALLDAQLLAEVYLELCGGRQPGLGMELAMAGARAGSMLAIGERSFRAARVLPGCAANSAELAAHEAFLKALKSPIWDSLLDTVEPQEKTA